MFFHKIKNVLPWFCLVPGGGTPILKLYGDVPPFRVWFFDRPLINRVST